MELLLRKILDTTLHDIVTTEKAMAVGRELSTSALMTAAAAKDQFLRQIVLKAVQDFQCLDIRQPHACCSSMNRMTLLDLPEQPDQPDPHECLAVFIGQCDLQLDLHPPI